MIWDIIEQTGFNAHFSSPDLSITTLLLDENIITEFKNENPQLLEFVANRKHQFIVELIEYTITMPQQSQGPDRCHRLPYISSELLAIDSNLIYDEFFKEGETVYENQYWKMLLTFLDTPASQNEILMGYFQKVINNLYDGNKLKTTCVVAHNLTRFTQLLPNGSIADVLKACIILLTVPDELVLTERKQILQHLLSMFASCPQEIKVSCSYILSEVVTKFQTFSSGEVIIEDLLSSQTLLKVYQIENSEAVNQFLTALICKTQQRTINQHDESIPLLSLPEKHKKQIDTYLQRESQNIRNVAKSTGFIVNQNQTTVRKSNKAMYSLLKLLALALEQGINGFVNEGLIAFLWNLVLLYPYNNILHVIVHRIFMGTLKGSSASRDIFLSSYEASVLKISEQHLTLLRPFIYQIWMQAKKYPTVTTDPNLLTSFSELVSKHLEPLVQYEVKATEHHHNLNKKLIVDEQDTTGVKVEATVPEHEEHQIQTPQKVIDQEKIQQIDSKLSKAFQNFDVDNKTGSDIKEEKQKDGFDFFGDWSGHKDQEKKEQKEEGKAKASVDMFADFANFP